MKVLIIGAGFVGTATAAALADAGHDITVFDIDIRKIKAFASAERAEIESCIFEEGLADLLKRHKERLHFTIDQKKLAAVVLDCEVIFLCLPTPRTATGAADLSALEKVVKTLTPLIKKRSAKSPRLVMVIKSTVPISYIAEFEKKLAASDLKNVGVAVNPEFLAEGKAVSGSLHPERVVVGARTPEDFKTLAKLFQRFVNSATVKYLEVGPEEAMAGKLAANFVLFERVMTCFDVVGRMCEVLPNLQFEQVREIVKTDSRIGGWGWYDSLYAGGSCFVKDASSLAYQIKKSGASASLVEEILSANERQLNRLYERMIKEGGVKIKGAIFTLLGAAFKQGTNDVRISGALYFAEKILKQHPAELRIFDPVAGPEAQKYFAGKKEVRIMKTAAAALENAQVVIIGTDWPEFQALAPLILDKAAPKCTIVDGRRLLHHDYEMLRRAGCTVVPVGGPTVKEINGEE
ncbi:MAG: UDP-glucose 6-dehydrogenase [Candidatus Magasanikbacteria bacterium]|nr:UDP-glucose 6-dehydrogenase [Candidatus Magasanikbacteria bacterium]